MTLDDTTAIERSGDTIRVLKRDAPGCAWLCIEVHFRGPDYERYDQRLKEANQ